MSSSFYFYFSCSIVQYCGSASHLCGSGSCLSLWCGSGSYLSLNADPGLTFHCDADPDPTFHSDAVRIRILASKLKLNPLKKGSNRLIFHTFWLVICKFFSNCANIYSNISSANWCGSGFSLSLWWGSGSSPSLSIWYGPDPDPQHWYIVILSTCHRSSGTSNMCGPVK